ncbi:MAG: hypothetical protein DME10_26540 [Candidatus Rokuibacteriota bacterium]|nr:MAG: hypothetical protein DME10_26540 [Candidatus Rokubacteria bacterium]
MATRSTTHRGAAMSSQHSPALEQLLSTRAKIGMGASLPPARPVEHAQYDFGGGFPDPASFPYDGIVEVTARMMKAEGAQALTYGTPQGYLGLRELVCHKYELFEGLKVKPENIVVSNGSGHALSLAFSAFLDVGDVMITEAPTFSGTLHTIRRHGPEIVDVPVDGDGLVTSVLREKLATLRKQGRRCKLIYTIPNFQNPAGPTLTLKRRQEVVALAQEFDTVILEDDAYGELRFEGEPQPSLFSLDTSGRVVRAGTISKILGAGMRLGWLLAPSALVPVLQSFLFGGGVAPFTSRVSTWYMRDNMAEHVKVLVNVYRDKRDAMLPRTPSACRRSPARRACSTRRGSPSSPTAEASATSGWPSPTSRPRSATKARDFSAAPSSPRRHSAPGGGVARATPPGEPSGRRAWSPPRRSCSSAPRDTARAAWATAS